jgi:hypothetical protein
LASARDVERRAAEADEREAAAQRARAEAEQRVAQAQQLESAAQEHRASLEQERSEIDKRLARADQLDPRVAARAEPTATTRVDTATGDTGEIGEADPDTEAPGRRLSTEDTEVIPETSTRSERG